jgi:3'-5' exonuclease
MIKTDKILFFDIETTSQYPDWQSFLMNDRDGASVFKLKHERAKSNNNNQWSDDIEIAYKKMGSLTPEFGKIIVFSYGLLVDGIFKTVTKTENDFDDEKLFMEYIAKAFKRVDELNIYIGGHNIKEFDIPFIFKRLLKFAIKIPRSLNFIDKKPWEIVLCDTALLTKGTSNIVSSLSDVTHLLGLKSPKDDISGAEVHTVYWNDKNLNRIAIYCEKDVIAVKEIYEKLFDCLN